MVAKKLRIFINHSNSDVDNKKAKNLYEKLKSANYDPWIDDFDIVAGTSWEASIEAAVKQSDVFLCLLSSGSVARRGMLRKEIKFALDIAQGFFLSDIFIIPILLEKCDVPVELQKYQYIDMSDKKYWEKLIKAFDRVLIQKREIANSQKKNKNKVSMQENNFENKENHLNPISKFFVGREEALLEYYRLFSYRRQKNILFVKAEGGLGKSWLLHHIYEENFNRKINRKVYYPIDFYNINYRSVKGVKEEIVQYIGKKNFARFIAAEKEQIKVESEKKSPTILASKKERADIEFFEDLNRATIGQEVVFLFDTFEVVHNTEVGRWFIEEFLERTENIIVVFAGRPTDINVEVPFKTITIELSPFNQNEAEKFFRSQADRIHFDPDALSSEDINKLRIQEGIDGLPLRLELALKYLARSGNRGLDRILSGELSRKEVEEMLIDFVGSKRERINHVFEHMSILKRRFDREIIEYLLNNGVYNNWFSSYEEISNELRSHFIVKTYIDGSFALHDRIQDLVEEHILPKPRFGINDDASLDLFDRIVDGWYIEKINNTKTDKRLRELLKSEHLGYMLDRLPDRSGVDLYNACFEDVKRNNLFSYNELLLHELYSHRLILEKKGYELFNEQGEWLYKQNQFNQASGIYKMMIREYSDDPKILWNSLSYWGACLLVHGKFEKAKEEAFSIGYDLANEAKDYYWISLFENYLAYVEEVFGNWNEARLLYERSFEHAEYSKNKDLIRKMRIKLGEFEALIGNYERARSYCEPVVRLEQNYSIQTRGEAYLTLGKINRYQDRISEADVYYQNALKCFTSQTGGNEWVCITLQNLGANYISEGYNKRKSYQDIEGALLSQEKALSVLIESLGLIRQYGLSIYLPETLYRLGRVLTELFEISNYRDENQLINGDKNVTKKLHELINLALQNIEIPEEDRWRNLKKLLPGLPMTILIKNRDLLGVAQRLCEVSYLEADFRERVHASLEGLIEAARIALKRKRFSEVFRYSEKVEFLKGVDYQEKLFVALINIILADLYLEKGNLVLAFERYKENFLTLIREKGYGIHRFNRHYKELTERIVRLPHDQAKQFLQDLISYWSPELEQDFPHVIIDLKGLLDAFT